MQVRAIWKSLLRISIGFLLTGIAGGPNLRAYVAEIPVDVARQAGAAKATKSSAGAKPSVLAEHLQQVALPRSRPANAAEAAEIRRLIRQMAEIDSPDFGFAPTLSGTDFAPVADSESAGAMVLTNPGIKRSTAFTKLVTLGPRALPFLLQAIDDPSPTKFTIKPEAIFGWMQFAHEMGGSPAYAREQTLLSVLPTNDLDQVPSQPGSYTVTVGDVCFVAVGQIVGRPYQAARYQPSGGIVVNSPTHYPIIARTVRAIWSSNDPAKRLFDSLMLDYSGMPSAAPAAMRLLSYYPRQTVSRVAARLDRLQVQGVVPDAGNRNANAEMVRWQKRELANGVRTDEFVKSVSWCREPQIRKALRSVFVRTGDPDIMLAAVEALDHQEDWPLVRKKLMAFLVAQPPDGGLDEERMLFSLRALGGERARPVFRTYLKNATAERCFIVCQALESADGAWDREFLWPMLSDKRPGKYRDHPVSASASDPRLPVRVCDAAFELIKRNGADPAYSLTGSNEELDREIAALQKASGPHPTGPAK